MGIYNVERFSNDCRTTNKRSNRNRLITFNFDLKTALK